VKVKSVTIQKKTKGHGDFIDLTADLHSCLSRSSFEDGLLTVFVIGSTAGITTFEYEPGLIKDMREIYEKLASSRAKYAHNETWHDENGFSHVRAALQGPSLVIPFEKKKLFLGTWQQVVLAEFDNRPRERKVVVQLMGV